MKLSNRVELKGSKRPMLGGAKLVGEAQPDEQIELIVKLRRKNPLPELNDRPEKPLTVDELKDKYGIDEEDRTKVKSELSKFGLTVSDPNEADNSVTVSGSIRDMQDAFGVKLFNYAHTLGGYRGRVGKILIPAALDGIVTGVFGLDTRRVAKKREPKTAVAKAAKKSKTGDRAWFYPAELAELYAFPSGDGFGQTIGLLEFGGGFFRSDLALFCKDAGIASVPKVTLVSVNGAGIDVKDGSEGEVMLDVEVVAGVCPKADIVVYFSTFDEKGWVTILDKALYDTTNKPTVISVSWGLAEDDPSWSQGAIDAINDSLKMGALLGLTICVAAGDDGSDDAVGDGHAHVDFPGCSPYVLSVGGTTLVAKNGAVVSEIAWKNGGGKRKPRTDDGSTGGGVSIHFQRPPWQNVSVTSVNPDPIDGRIVPDVAVDGNWDTGYFMVVDGKASPNGGTSASAPLWASLVIRINANLNGVRLGYLTPLLYKVLPGTNTTAGQVAFRDITQGNNVSAAIGGYFASAGFDAVSGWGVPIGTKLLDALKQLI